jgi:hypothetical protein
MAEYDKIVDNAKSGPTTNQILGDKKFALNLRQWCCEKNIKSSLKRLSGSKVVAQDQIQKMIHDKIMNNPNLFMSGRSKGKTAWNITKEYYDKFTRLNVKH